MPFEAVVLADPEPISKIILTAGLAAAVILKAMLGKAHLDANKLTKPPAVAGTTEGAGIQWIWEHVTLPSIVDPLDAAKRAGTLSVEMCQKAIVELQSVRVQVESFLTQNFPENPQAVQQYRTWLNKFTDQLIADRNRDIITLGGQTVDVTTLRLDGLGGGVIASPSAPEGGGLLETIGNAVSGLLHGGSNTPSPSTGGNNTGIAGIGQTRTSTVVPAKRTTAEWAVVVVGVLLLLLVIWIIGKRG